MRFVWAAALVAFAATARAAPEDMAARERPGATAAGSAADEGCAPWWAPDCAVALIARRLRASTVRISSQTWFEHLFGFPESVGSREKWEATRDNFGWTPRGTGLKSKANGREFEAGRFVVPSLEELRGRVDLGKAHDALAGRLSVKQVVGDVSAMHVDPENAYALFQAASQFNCLEFMSESITPEDGIAGYSWDHTQGPACATACAAGTVVRNYFAFSGKGQTVGNQVNNLRDVEELLNNAQERYFQVKNGYTLADESGLGRLTKLLLGSPEMADRVRARLRIGVQEDTEVTGSEFGTRPYTGEQLLVSQAYCSGISVAYSGCSPESWRAFATLVLDAAYEATLYAAVENALRHPEAPGSRKVFLTALGGGVFGNDMGWIVQAMKRSFDKFKDVGLEINIVSYGHPSSVFCSVFGAC